MSGKTGITMDSTDFMKGMKDYNKIVSKESKEAMRTIVDQLYNDSVMVSPTVPHLHGDLRGDTTRDVKTGNKSIEGSLVFNMPYAKDQHENTKYKHSEPGAGAKYLETKLFRFGKRYFGMMARAIRSIS